MKLPESTATTRSRGSSSSRCPLRGRGETAGDTQRKRITVEQPVRDRRRGQQRAAPPGQLPQRPGGGPGTSAGDEHGPLGGGDQLRERRGRGRIRADRGGAGDRFER